MSANLVETKQVRVNEGGNHLLGFVNDRLSIASYNSR